MRFLAVAEYRLLELSLLTLVVLNGVGIVSRYVFRHALGELFEVMILGGVAVFWLAFATAQRERAHLGIDSAVALLPVSGRRVVRSLRTLVVVGFFAVVVWSGALLVVGQYHSGITAGLIDLPLWMVAAFMPLSGAWMLWRVVRSEIRDASGG